MSSIIIYKSSTGFTKQYAEWISKELSCQEIDIKGITPDIVKQYDNIIFGGWIMGNMIMGLDKILKLNPKNLTIFAVGATPYSEKLLETIKTQNHIENQKLFYFVGGFHFEKLKLPVRLMLKAMKKSIVKKENKTEQDEYMYKTLGTSFDHSDRTLIDPLINEFM